jgi:hypothetical protein
VWLILVEILAKLAPTMQWVLEAAWIDENYFPVTVKFLWRMWMFAFDAGASVCCCRTSYSPARLCRVGRPVLQAQAAPRQQLGHTFLSATA